MASDTSARTYKGLVPAGHKKEGIANPNLIKNYMKNYVKFFLYVPSHRARNSSILMVKSGF